MNTEDFDIDNRVVIHNQKGICLCLNGVMGTAIDRDAYTVSVRLDTVPEEIKGYEDGRIGILNFRPMELKLIV